METNDALHWTRYDAALTYMKVADTYRVLASVGAMTPGHLKMLAEAREEYDRLTSIEREEARRDMDHRPTWAYVDVH